MTIEQGAMTSDTHNVKLDSCGCDFTADMTRDAHGCMKWLV